MEPLLRINQISKSYPGVQALSDISFELYSGEIIALVGENGAGKSTLMRILSGAATPDSGELIWQGQPVALRTPREAQELGIRMIHQELALLPNLDVAKNIYLGREPRGALPGTIDWKTLYQQAAAQLQQLELDIDPRTPIRNLSLAQQQMVEVAKSLSQNAQLIIMDEPTSTLTDREVETLFRKMRTLRDQGVTIIFISHRLEEIFAVCDRVVVLRDGQVVASDPVAETTPSKVIAEMVGRTVDDLFPRQRSIVGDPILDVQHLAITSPKQDLTFTLHQGEILGIAGLVGSGRTPLAEAIFGLRRALKGKIVLNGAELIISSPAQAIEHGIGFVPEDRKGQGLFLSLSVGANIIVSLMRLWSRYGWVQWGRYNDVSARFIDRLDIRTPSAGQRVRNLSGGNQQKVVIAKWLTMEPKVLILDEPTRGIDIGAKAEIHQLMRQLAERGVGILMISSELPEVLGVSDRILVMYEGDIVAEYDARRTTQDQVMRAATGNLEVKGPRNDSKSPANFIV
ncbi:MAG: sugar ABC transporter ATP-binding protein [Chloroflexi bacterium]|uniref:sugar ABC transporter ATP-binding protein n=1 Tax=Candidatus Flexifilum breve TaxID=3140694 RepID=UPI00313486AB|nr:sugar ABC transporter ATP-binding protein [Chloroflexota bacterium]